MQGVASSLGAVRPRGLAQWNLDTRPKEEPGIETSNLRVTRQPTLPPEPSQPNNIHDNVVNFFHKQQLETTCLAGIYLPYPIDTGTPWPYLSTVPSRLLPPSNTSGPTIIKMEGEQHLSNLQMNRPYVTRLWRQNSQMIRCYGYPGNAVCAEGLAAEYGCCGSDDPGVVVSKT